MYLHWSRILENKIYAYLQWSCSGKKINVYLHWFPYLESRNYAYLHWSPFVESRIYTRPIRGPSCLYVFLLVLAHPYYGIYAYLDWSRSLGSRICTYMHWSRFLGTRIYAYLHWSRSGEQNLCIFALVPLSGEQNLCIFALVSQLGSRIYTRPIRGPDCLHVLLFVLPHPSYGTYACLHWSRSVGNRIYTYLHWSRCLGSRIYYSIIGLAL